MLRILYCRTKIEANSQNSVLNQSAEEKTTRNSVPWNKNRSKRFEFCFEPFCGKDNNSFCSGEQKKKQTLGILFRGTKIEANTWNSVLNHSAEKKTTPNSVPENKSKSKLSEFHSEAFHGRKHALSSFCLNRIACKTHFSCNFVQFRASELTWNEYFLPQNITRNSSESIPRNFFGTKFRCQPDCWRNSPCILSATMIVESLVYKYPVPGTSWTLDIIRIWLLGMWAGERDFNFQDLQRFMFFVVDWWQEKFWTRIFTFLFQCWWVTFYSCSFFYGYFKTFEHCLREGGEMGG